MFQRGRALPPLWRALRACSTMRQRTVTEFAVKARAAADLHAAFASAAPQMPPAHVTHAQSLRAGERHDFKVATGIGLARRLGIDADVLARDAVRALGPRAEVYAEAEVQNGAVLLRLSDRTVARSAAAVADVARLYGPGSRASLPQHPRGRVLVDFASPNMSKELHAGHLRSSVVGDTLCRLLESDGWLVSRVSHVGDWGAPIVMVATHLLDTGREPGTLAPADLSAVYVTAKGRHTTDEEFAAAVTANIGELHRLVGQFAARHPPSAGAEFPVPAPIGSRAHADAVGASPLWRAWCHLCESSRAAIDAVLAPLGVQAVEVGESAYAGVIPEAMSALERQALAERGADGALRVRLPAQGRRKEQEVVVQRSGGGGHLYATTDLAALAWRGSRGYDRLLYVVDGSQSLHFENMFAIAQRAGWLRGGGTAEHVQFGLVKAPGGTKISSREGTELTLSRMYSLAYEEALRVVSDSEFKSAIQASASMEQVAAHIAHNSLRYYALAHRRQEDYTLNVARMMSFRGDSAVYLMYAATRIRSVLARAGVEAFPAAAGRSSLDVLRDADGWGGALDEAERALAMAVALHADAVAASVEELAPHRLTEHLGRVATAYHAFYARCRVIGSEREAARLALSCAALAVLEHGMHLLGITPVDRM